MASITESMFEQVPKPQTPEKLPNSLAGPEQIEKPPSRPLPWLIDIFLFPLCRNGLIMLAIFIGIPLFVELVKYYTMKLSSYFDPLVVVFFLAYVAGVFITLLVLVYIYWYLCHCIRSSAEGDIRAPDIIAVGPSLGEMLLQIIKIIMCLAVFAFPPVLYYHITGRTDAVTIILIGVSVFFYPMALLSIVMFDSMAGLNPIIVIGSIFSTFFRYTALAAFLAFLGYIAVKVFRSIPQTFLLSWVRLAANIYFFMVAAHLLGRFYYKCQDKLRWDV